LLHRSDQNSAGNKLIAQTLQQDLHASLSFQRSGTCHPGGNRRGQSIDAIPIAIITDFNLMTIADWH
jgi:hypothetical protein